MKVSIIIPVYNTEKYLRRCVESCLNQTLKDTEIILIDDCSQDGSRNIITEYSKKYPEKVRYIFQQTNQRQGAARNQGMEIAEGEYFIFVDSDDWIEPDMCEKLYNKAVETNADMVGSSYYKSWDSEDLKIKVNIKSDMCGAMTAIKKRIYTENYGMFWTRIYKSSFLKKYNLYFPENIFYEDAFFNFYSVLYSGKIEHIDEYFYHYYQENQSTVRNRNNPHQYERIRLAEYIFRYGSEKSELEQYKDIIDYKYLYMQGANLIYTCLEQFDKPDKKQIFNIANAVKSNFKNLHHCEAYKKLSDEFRFYIRLAILCPTACIWMYKTGIYNYYNVLQNKLHKGKQNEADK